MTDEQQQPVEQEEVLVTEPVVDDKPLSLRDAIVQAKEKAVNEQDAQGEVKQRQREQDGKFAKEPKEKVAPVKTEPPQQVVEEVKPHDRYSPTIKAKWKELPVEVQRDLVKSAEDFHKELTRHDEERVLARQFKEAVAPYVAQMRAENAEPIGAIKSLLNTAFVLRTGSAEQKRQLLLETARTFGVDLSQGNPQQAQQQVHPVLQQTWQEMQNLKAQLEHQAALKKQQEDADVQRQIEAFSADPKNIHFETVKADMAALLQAGRAKDLADAYDKAVYANPQTRASLLTQAQQAEQEKRVAEQTAKAAAARKAGSSVKGSPGMGATKDPKIVQPDLRSELRAAFAAQGNA